LNNNKKDNIILNLIAVRLLLQKFHSSTRNNESNFSKSDHSDDVCEFWLKFQVPTKYFTKKSQNEKNIQQVPNLQKKYL